MKYDQVPLEKIKIKSGMKTLDSPGLALTPSEKQTPLAEKVCIDDIAPPAKSNKPLSLPLRGKREPNGRQKFLSM